MRWRQGTEGQRPSFVGSGAGHLFRIGVWTLACVAILILCAAPAASGKAARNTRSRNTLSRKQVLALIEKAGRTPPRWWASVPLRVPQGMNLKKARLGGYCWKTINPNRRRWKGGIRLLHHALRVNQDDAQRRKQIMGMLGTLYYTLLEDYPRAAFWWQKAEGNGESFGEASLDLGLADCYFRLGNRDMAMKILSSMPRDETRSGSLIKLWSQLGDTKKALALAEARAEDGRAVSAYLAAGDVCRRSGDTQQALIYYEKVLQLPSPDKFGADYERNQQCARANIEAIKVTDALDLARIVDGAYAGNSLGYNGQVHVEIVLKGGRISRARVTKHREKQSYSSITDMPRRVIEKQGLRGVDATTGATITSVAIISATSKALASAIP